MSLCLQNHTLSPFVIMSFCLKKCACLAPSLCYSVFKTNPSVTPVLLLLCLQNYPVSLCHYVIMSKKMHLSRPVPLLFCLQKLPCLATYITTYILLAIGFFVLYLCIVIRNENGDRLGIRRLVGLRRTRLSVGDGPDNEKSNNLLYIRYMMNDNLFNEIDLSERLSPHFTVGEMMRSGEAVKRRIKNVPKTEGRDGEVLREEVMENLKALCACVLEPLRRHVGRVIVTSGYRSPVLNKAIHGAFDSQHLRGEAVDIHVTGAEMCRKYAAVLRQTDFDQMILEPLEATCKRWIHISYRRDGRNRHQILGEK